MSKAVYVDANVILAFLRAEPGRVDIIDACFTRAQLERDVRLFTSTISVVEIIHLSERGEQVDANDFQEIKAFWKTAPIVRVDLNSLVAERARETMQARLTGHRHVQLPDIRKRIRDLCHIGTAQWIEAEELWTYDPDFERYPTHGIRITRPHTDQPTLM